MKTLDRKRDLAQPMEALRKANEVYQARADLKRKVTAGDLTVKDVLLKHAEVCRTMKLGELLRAQKRWGHYRAGMLCDRVGLDPSKTVGSLTERQAWTIIDAIPKVKA